MKQSHARTNRKLRTSEVNSSDYFRITTVDVFPFPGVRSSSPLPAPALELPSGVRRTPLTGGCAFAGGRLGEKPFAVVVPLWVLFGVTKPPPSELSPGLDWLPGGRETAGSAFAAAVERPVSVLPRAVKMTG